MSIINSMDELKAEWANRSLRKLGKGERLRALQAELCSMTLFSIPMGLVETAPI